MLNSNPGKFLAGLAHRMATAAYHEAQEKTMTNAIEQSKREMYSKLAAFKIYAVELETLEGAIESYLELLRQDHEALHETARKRFEDIQGLEKANQALSEKVQYWRGLNLNQMNTIEALQERLAKINEDRDSFRNRLQAYEARESQTSTSGQYSGDRSSCAALDGKTAAILGALLDAQSVMVEYLVPDGIRAKDAIGKMIPILDNEKLYLAMRGFEHPNVGYAAWFINNTRCMHSFHPAFPGGEQCVFCGVGK